MLSVSSKTMISSCPIFAHFGHVQLRCLLPAYLRWYGVRSVSTSLSGQTFQPVRKDFYNELPVVSQRTQPEIETRLANHNITRKGRNIPNPFLSVEEANFPTWITEGMTKHGFHKFSVIQSVAMPVALKGRDLVGVSATGSGKTLGFLWPAFLHIAAQSPPRQGDGPIVLVIVPTRELAMQIHQECIKFGPQFSSACLYGGVSPGPQIGHLRRGCQIVVSTPGRLIDMLERGATNLRRTSYLVFDEADRMLDMGFEPQIRKIVSQTRPDRQTCMWSATWPKEVQQMAHDFLTDPIQINVGSTELVANRNVQQILHFCTERDKRGRLIDLFRSDLVRKKCLVFTETKRGCESLAFQLSSSGIQAGSLNGGKSQSERDSVTNDFRQNPKGVLVATDVASRGLDIRDIEVVVNYDFPKAIEDYIHRIGRTGRAGAFGVAHSFFTPENARLANQLIQTMQRAGQPVPRQLYDVANSPALKQIGGRAFHHKAGRSINRHGNFRSTKIPSY